MTDVELVVPTPEREVLRAVEELVVPVPVRGATEVRVIGDVGLTVPTPERREESVVVERLPVAVTALLIGVAESLVTVVAPETITELVEEVVPLMGLRTESVADTGDIGVGPVIKDAVASGDGVLEVEVLFIVSVEEIEGLATGLKGF